MSFSRYVHLFAVIIRVYCVCSCVCGASHRRRNNKKPKTKIARWPFQIRNVIIECKNCRFFVCGYFARHTKPIEWNFALLWTLWCEWIEAIVIFRRNLFVQKQKPNVCVLIRCCSMFATKHTQNHYRKIKRKTRNCIYFLCVRVSGLLCLTACPLNRWINAQCYETIIIIISSDIKILFWCKCGDWILSNSIVSHHKSKYMRWNNRRKINKKKKKPLSPVHCIVHISPCVKIHWFILLKHHKCKWAAHTRKNNPSKLFCFFLNIFF